MLKTNLFDLVLSSAAAVSYFGGYGINGMISKPLSQGLQFFALANVIDRIMLRFFAKDVKLAKSSFIYGTFSAIADEGLYAGILLTQTKRWLIPRFAASLIVGATATRSLINVEANNPNGFTLDTKIGFLWALIREACLCTLPLSYSIPLLCASDGIIFSLAEVCPNAKNPPLPRFSMPWKGKALSAFFFRVLGNHAASKAGISTEITGHALFNISRTFSSRS